MLFFAEEDNTVFNIQSREIVLKSHVAFITSLSYTCITTSIAIHISQGMTLLTWLLESMVIFYTDRQSTFKL